MLICLASIFKYCNGLSVFMNPKKLNPKASGLSFGILYSASLFLLALLPVLFNGWAKTAVLEMSSLYIGYGPSFKGALFGLVYGFVMGSVFGYLLALLYNKFSR